MRSTSLSIPGVGHPSYARFLYRAWAPVYDRTIALDPAFRVNARRMLDSTVRNGDRVLDVGVGTGLLFELAAGHAVDYTGIDVSGAMLARAARKVAAGRFDHVALRWGDARSLPFEDRSFDTVVCSFVLPHFDASEKVMVLSEMARVLTAGGHLGLFLAQGEIAPLFPERQEIEQLLTGAGFVDIDITDRDDVYRVATATMH